MRNFDFPVENVFSVGFYDIDGEFYHIWGKPWGYCSSITDYFRRVSSYAVRYSSERGYGEKRVSREEAGRVLKAMGV